MNLEDGLIIPRVEPLALKIHPVVMLLLMVVGTALAGVWALIFGAALASTILEVVKYFRQEWDRDMPTAILLNVTGPVLVQRTPGCG